MTAKSKKAPAAAAAASKVKTTTKLQRHPLSEKFSLPTSEDERLALSLDMKSNGQHQDIILFQGMVLDGWERYMGCLQQGLTPQFKEYKGDNPAAVAFGANAMRRKLSSVQKALFGAKYFMHAQSEGLSKITQKDVAKSACCSLQRLNELVQLLRKSDSDANAAKCLATLNTNPDVTTAMLQSMLVDCGIVEANDRKPSTTAPRTAAADPDDDADDDEGDADGADDSVDLLGGADIDDLLDDDDPLPTKRNPTPKGDVGNLPKGRIGVDKRPRETPPSSAARTFKALTEPERVDFVKFAWAMLRPAIEACLDQGRIEWPRLHATADAGKSAMADVGAALAKASSSAKAAAATTPKQVKTPRVATKSVKTPKVAAKSVKSKQPAL
jgi:hypothetical protein